MKEMKHYIIRKKVKKIFIPIIDNHMLSYLPTGNKNNMSNKLMVRRPIV